MSEADRIKYLKIALVIFGIIFIFGVWPLTIVWPSGWAWHAAGRSEYLEMIVGIYATLGVFLLIASRDPLAHRSLIWFTVWSSVVHALIMGWQAVARSRRAGAPARGRARAADRRDRARGPDSGPRESRAGVRREPDQRAGATSSGWCRRLDLIRATTSATIRIPPRVGQRSARRSIPAVASRRVSPVPAPR